MYKVRIYSVCVFYSRNVTCISDCILFVDKFSVGIPDHEFPQPFDQVIRGDDVITSSVGGSNITDVTFFQSSTQIMVGPIPVLFGEMRK